MWPTGAVMSPSSAAVEECEDLADELTKTNFLCFAERVFYTLNPGQEYVWGEYLMAMADALGQVERNATRRLLVTIAPRTLKSILMNVAWSAWLLGHNPRLRIISVSYSLDLSHHLSFQTRRVMESDWYRRIFPNVLDPKGLSKDEIRTRKLGFRMATSVGGTLTGRGGDIIIIDDPISANDAFSSAVREATQDWFSSTLMSRLDNPKTGAIVVVSQRLHTDDIPGRLIAAGGWTHLDLPILAPKEQTVRISDDLTWTRVPGDPLHPSRMDRAQLQQLKKELSPEVWEAQYMQRPSPPGGFIFKLDEFKTYKMPVFKPTLFEAVVASVDTGISTLKTADYTAATVWGIKGATVYLVHAERDRLSFNEQVALVERLSVRYQLKRTIIEQAAGGQLLIEELRRRGRNDIINYNPRGDKLTRAHAATAKIHQGLVAVPSVQPTWYEAFMAEVAAFPNGKNDDWVDSMTQFLHCLNFGLQGIGLTVYHGQGSVNVSLFG